MTDILRVGIVGCGGISKAHVRSYGKLKGVRIVSVCDINAEAAKSIATELGATAYTSIDEVISREKLDAASVCTPPTLHTEQVKALLSAGLHVLCEKPLSHRVEDAKAMAAAANEAKRILMTAFCWRFHGIRRELKKRIDAGKIGRPVLFTYFGGCLAKKLEGRWFGDPSKGGGVVREASVHMIDQIRWFMGEIESVQAQTATLALNMQAEDTVLASLKLKSGALANLIFSWGAPGASTLVEITGTEGTLTETGANTGAFRRGEDDAAESFSSESADRFGEEVAHFVRAAQGKEVPEITPHDGVRATEVALAIIESADTGKAVQV
jgi:predicted dehydrogenase